MLYNVLEELRNAGAEVIQLGELALTASCYFVGTPTGIEVDGSLLKSPYRWVAIGDPETITTRSTSRAARWPGRAQLGGTTELSLRTCPDHSGPIG